MNTPQKIFLKELEAIQQRHSFIFPKEKIKYVKMINGKSGYRLEINPRFEVDSTVKMEINLAFKLSI